MTTRTLTPVALEALRGCIERAREYDAASMRAINAACNVLGVPLESDEADGVQNALIDWALGIDEPDDNESEALRALRVEIVRSSI